MITTMTMTKKERQQREVFKDFLNPPLPKNTEARPFTKEDRAYLKKISKKIKPIFDKAEKEGRLYAGH